MIDDVLKVLMDHPRFIAVQALILVRCFKCTNKLRLLEGKATYNYDYM